MTQGQFNAQMSKENEEYMQALSKQEVHKKELEETAKQLEAYKREVEPLKTQSENLKALYDKQDGILGETFVFKVMFQGLYCLFPLVSV